MPDAEMGSLSPKIHGKSLGKDPFQVAKQQKSGTDFLDFLDPQAFSLLTFPYFPQLSHHFPPIVHPFDTSFTPLLSQGSHEFPKDQGLQGIARRTAVVTKGARQIAEMGYEEEELPSL
jgi:hypothetical protein